jgi:branched-chain amino acid transport system permease protein
MTLDLFSQLFVNGLTTGMIYVLIASGLILVLGVARIFNFAHGEFYMLGAYATFALCQVLQVNFFVSLVLATLVVALFAAICYRVVFHHIRGNLLLCAAASMGLSMMFERGALVSFGTQERGLPSAFTGVMTIGTLAMPVEKIAVILLCVANMLGLYYLLMRTKLGKAMRAVKLDTEVAALQGINTTRVYGLAMAVGCALSGLAGGIIAPLFSITPAMGHAMLLKCFMVLIVGGLESMVGGVVGGLVIGMTLSFGYYFLGGLSEILLFSIIGVILVFKPGGLFGEAVEDV